MMREKVFVFIDSQNLNLGIKDQGWNLDFARFYHYLKDKFKVDQVYLFIGLVPKNQSLYTFLQKAGFILVFKPVMELADGRIKGNVDAELVLHTMIEYHNYDKAIIVTGDGDFFCLVEYLNKQDKLLKLLVPNAKKYSKLLKSIAVSKIDFMNNLRSKLEKKDIKKEGQLLKD